MIYIYILSDPRTSAVRYVGCSSDPDRRLYEHTHHMQHDSNPWKEQWLSELLNANELPVLEVVSAFEDRDAVVKQEDLLIACLREVGCNLVNRRDVGVPGRVPTQETRERTSKTLRNRAFSAEHRAAISSSKLGHTTSQETRQKIGESNYGKRRNEAQTAALSQAMKESWLRRKQRSTEKRG